MDKGEKYEPFKIRKEIDTFETEAREILSSKEYCPKAQNRAYFVARRLAYLSGEVYGGSRFALLGYKVLEKVGEAKDEKLIALMLENAKKDRTQNADVNIGQLEKAVKFAHDKKFHDSVFLSLLGVVLIFMGLFSFNPNLTGNIISFQLVEKANLFVGIVLCFVGIFLFFASFKK